MSPPDVRICVVWKDGAHDAPTINEAAFVAQILHELAANLPPPPELPVTETVVSFTGQNRP